MSVDVKYRGSAAAIGGRDGRAYTDDGSFDLRLAIPAELGGSGAAGTNPEQLFAAAYSGCFLSALHLAARNRKIELPEHAMITASVGIGPKAGSGFGLTASLVANLPNVDRVTAEQLVAAAHEICPFSAAVRNNVDVDISVS